MRKFPALSLALLLAGSVAVVACGDEDDSVFSQSDPSTDDTSDVDEPTDTSADTTDVDEPTDTIETDGSTATSDSISNPLDDLPTTGSPSSGQIADMLEDVYADMGYNFTREQVECLVDEMGLDQISAQSDMNDVMDDMMGNIMDIMQTCDINPLEVTGS